ncbi:hypothetical protein KM317_09190 [Xanthomonas translucens pv. arrhenatheri]|nr:hypothetical protein [Xanthomonas translucens]UKE79676.1 hypothetical protein KM317_09190 [Xanthomonas translucens pv. arrhenatheri]
MTDARKIFICWRGFHHHATLCIAAYGLRVAERLRGVLKKNRHGARNLLYPKMTAHAAQPSGAQRHVSDSIAPSRWMIAIAIGAKLLDEKQPISEFNDTARLAEHTRKPCHGVSNRLDRASHHQISRTESAQH